MAEPHFAGDDDLPRALRRERDARDREQREREQRERDAAMAAQHQPYPQQPYPQPGSQTGYGPDVSHHDYAHPDQSSLYPMPGSGVVNRLEIPFLHLVWFFVKAVFAAIPALLLLTALLFAGGQVLKRFFPDLRHFEIIIKSADQDGAAVARPAPPAATKK